ncbi:uncharacterized protein LOC143255764 isoform X3 [Tachypleus tridentatus]|uniref:uncharacterized protein LOC143255764 isoform X3 n=1 Tax=Tachypleus tridentatus TaxID=6853 RepID=UPI003FD2EC8A
MNTQCRQHCSLLYAEKSVSVCVRVCVYSDQGSPSTKLLFTGSARCRDRTLEFIVISVLGESTESKTNVSAQRTRKKQKVRSKCRSIVYWAS